MSDVINDLVFISVENLFISLIQTLNTVIHKSVFYPKYIEKGVIRYLSAVKTDTVQKYLN